jgi:squalene-associated FAD-dependent desaturase
MATAWRLLTSGYSVTLVERRPYLGGRAYSYQDKETGLQIDNGQHVFLGCCTAYTGFLQEIGTLELTSRQPSLHVQVRDAAGKAGFLSAVPLPSPLHLLPGFLLYPHISFMDKLRAIPVLLRISRTKNRDNPELQNEDFESWLRRHHQSERAIRNFWEFIILPTCNDPANAVSASTAFMIFQVGFLESRHNANVGFARAGLSDVMGTAAERKLQERGATLLLGRTVKQLLIGDNGALSGVELADGERLEADWYVSALPAHALPDLLPQTGGESSIATATAAHTYAPIVNLHVWSDRPVADFEFAAFVGSPVQWVFNKSRIMGEDGPGEYLTASLSGAWEHWPESKEALQERFTKELAQLLPRARVARVVRFQVVKEQRATFRSLPGTTNLRLPAQTSIRNFVLAGDWTDTGWPATMEGAVRSGETAAAHIMSSSGAGASR